MIHDNVVILKTRDKSELENKCLSIIKIKSISENDLIDLLSEKGFKKYKVKEAIIYLINSHDVKRNGEMLEYVEWKI